MENTKKQYWKGLEELTKNPEFEKYAEKEFPEYLPINGESEDSTGASRRDFLKLMGFGVAAASLAACETPVRKAIPYLNKPAELDSRSSQLLCDYLYQWKRLRFSSS